MSKAAIYARVSTSERQEYDRQVKELIEIVKEQKIQEYEVFAEKVSGYKKIKDRPELNKLVQITENDPTYFKCIYTSEISRIGRDPKHTREIIDRWTELKIPVYIQSLKQSTLNEDGSRNTIMNIILQVLIEYADLEAQTFKTRSKSGLLKSAKDGKAGGGKNFPYGYKKDKRKNLVVDKEEAETVKLIFDLYDRGNGIKVISNILNEKKIPTRIKKSYGDRIIKFKRPKLANQIKWSDKQIHDILRNTIYKGERKFKNQILEIQPIISSELFDKCNHTLKNKRTKNTTTKYLYLLKDHIVCGKCGRNYFGRYKPEKHGDKVYKCSSTLYKGESCGNLGINISFIESVIFKNIIEADAAYKYLNNNNKFINETKNIIKDIPYKIQHAESELVENEKQEERLLDGYLKDLIHPKKFEKKQKELENLIKKSKRLIKNLNKELHDNKELLKYAESKETTRNQLINTKRNRGELKLIYDQIIHKIIVNTFDRDLSLITVLIKVENVVLKNTIKLVLDLSGMRKNPKIYRFKGATNVTFEPVFDNNYILISEFEPLINEIMDNKVTVIEEFWKNRDLDITDKEIGWEYLNKEHMILMDIH